MTDKLQTLTRLGDFDPAKFTIYAYRGACGHSAPAGPETAGQEVEIRRLASRPRCGECGCRECSIRIVYTGPGEFEYREG